MSLLLTLWLGGVAAQRSCPNMAERCPMSPPYDKVTITTDDSFRYVETFKCPPYKNPLWTNPAWACSGDTTYTLPLVPKFAAKPIPVGQKLSIYDDITYLVENPPPILGALGILQNGVNIFGVGSPCGFSSKCPNEGGPSIYVDAVEAEGNTVDQCGGHASPQNTYHIHSGTGIVNGMQRTACKLPADKADKHSQLLGWMFDGVGLYGPNCLGGVPPTDLDGCGGHTHAIDGVQTYHYHLPDPPAFPWTIGCYKACPKVSNNPHELQFLNTDPTFGCEDDQHVELP